MPIEDQVVQIYAATNGYLDRIKVDKVNRFLADLTDNVRGNEPELLEQIADGNWEDSTQEKVEKAVEQFAEDFGYDLDEEGNPLDEDEDEEKSSDSSDSDSDGGGSGDGESESGSADDEQESSDSDE
jgi:F-type H+-transporting ATPase subunit alpha